MWQIALIENLLSHYYSFPYGKRRKGCLCLSHTFSNIQKKAVTVVWWEAGTDRTDMGSLIYK